MTTKKKKSPECAHENVWDCATCLVCQTCGAKCFINPRAMRGVYDYGYWLAAWFVGDKMISVEADARGPSYATSHG